mgnify:CR=1 FL=1
MITTERKLIFVALVLVLVLAGLLIWPEKLAPNRLPPGGEFTLNSADGPVSLTSLRGKVVLLYFGYTYCPDICPTALLTHAAAFKQLTPEELRRVAGLFVSVDPERDSLAHLKQYAHFFHPVIAGLTGTPAEIQEIAARYGVFYARQPPDDSGRYSVDHTSESYLIAADGRLVARLPHASPPETIAAEIRRWLP